MSESKKFDAEKLADLLAKVQAATGPDHDLDAEVWLAIVPGASRKNLMAGWPQEAPLWEYHDAERNTLFRAGLLPAVTASIDAALALVEKMLPGWFCTIATKTLKDDVIGGPWADLASPEWIDGTTLDGNAESHGATPALAVLAALLSALSSIKEVGK